MRLLWHPLAHADLTHIVTFVAAENPGAAFFLFEEIDAQVRLLMEHPEMGRSGRVVGTRELVIVGTPYIAAYRIADEAITILRVLHGARRWPADLPLPQRDRYLRTRGSPL